MDDHVIAWDPQPREIAADPAATLSLDRTRLEELGASFEFYDDELGGSTAIATGLACVFDRTLPSRSSTKARAQPTCSLRAPIWSILSWSTPCSMG